MEEMKYEDGFKIVHDAKEVCEIVRWLGRGAMGTVYLGKLSDGSLCAVKTVREDVSAKDRMQHEQQFAVEASIGFAMGRHALIASVLGIIVPLPDIVSTAKGMLLLSDLVDSGDLEEAMSTKAAVAKEQPDYLGTFWDEPSASKWPISTVTLQIFLGFHHIHARGVLHQVDLMYSSFSLRS